MRRRPLTSRLWAAASTTLLVVLGVFALFAIVVPLLLGAQTYTVLTGSMRPTMPPGTLIGVKPVDVDRIRIGDVITYQLESGLPAVVTHRVVSLSQTGDGRRTLRTQGDDNSAPDEDAVLPEQVRGVVVYSVPYLGYPGSLVTGETRSVFVIVLGTAVLVYGAIALIRDLRRGRREKRAAS